MAYKEIKLNNLRKDIAEAHDLATELGLKGNSDYIKLRLAAVCDDLESAVRNLDLAEEELER